MCGGVQFKHEGKTLKVYFPSSQAALLVRLKSGGHMLLPWGRREGEAEALLVGGWARHESILVGKWDRFSPKAVRLDLEDAGSKGQRMGDQTRRAVRGHLNDSQERFRIRCSVAARLAKEMPIAYISCEITLMHYI
jgi:hypothetical protein